MKWMQMLVLCEDVGSVLWFGTDVCWMLNWQLTAEVLCTPTLILHLALFAYTPRTVTALAPVLATNAWVLMNVSWMLNDFEVLEWGLTVAYVALVIGLICLPVVIRSIWRYPAQSVLHRARFRRFRILTE